MELHYLLKLRRWLWLLILSTLVFAGIAYVVVKNQPPTFEANTKLLIGPGVDSANPDLNSLRAGGQLMQTYAEIVYTTPVLQTVIDNLHLVIDTKTLSRKIDVKYNTDTQIMSITVKDADPYVTVAIANAVASALVGISPSASSSTETMVIDQIRTQVADLEVSIPQAKDTIQKLESSLQNYADRTLTPAEAARQKELEQILASERTRLDQMRSTLNSMYDNLRKSNTNQVEIIEKASAGSSVNRNAQLYILVAGMAGFLLSLVFVLAYEYFDDTVRSSKELEELTNIPVLATIMSQESLDMGNGVQLIESQLPASPVAEAYRQVAIKILPALSLGSPDEPVNVDDTRPTIARLPINNRTLMVTGLQSGDDASNIAANLAVVFSQLGLNTVLVDTDFYEPKVSELFSVNSDKGLLKALDDVDNGVLSENLIAISPTLSILPKGSAASSRQESATFFELLVSKHMREVLKNLKTKANATILVSPPLLHYSESLVLASKVDGVILVGYKDRSKRKYIHQAIEGLQAHGVKILGIVMVKDQPSTGSSKLNKTSKLNSSRQPIMADIRER